jgi:hypothetical protein
MHTLYVANVYCLCGICALYLYIICNAVPEAGHDSRKFEMLTVLGDIYMFSTTAFLPPYPTQNMVTESSLVRLEHKEVYIVSSSKNFNISAVHIYTTVVHYNRLQVTCLSAAVM